MCNEGLTTVQAQAVAGARRESELQRRVTSLAADAQSAAESQALLEVLTDRQEAASAALAVMPIPTHCCRWPAGNAPHASECTEHNSLSSLRACLQ